MTRSKSNRTECRPEGLNRRTFLQAGGYAALIGVTGCTATGQTQETARRALNQLEPTNGKTSLSGDEFAYYANMYAAQSEEKFPLPAVPFQRIDPVFYRRLVDDPTGEKPGTIIVDTSHHLLYLTLGDGKSMRYGVGLGRAGFEWAGRGVIQYKRAWPRWTPPDEMVARQPELEPYSIANGGMEPGLNNPLGARALYIFQNGTDTLYRIHGSPEWWSIGKSVSSGCVRMLSQDVIDLYNRVTNGSPILVTSLTATA
ncbi:L,D-transpeptidase [Labrenzia sp. MBR-25]|jgi:lipoprotein-anchoring transpeptidase ErfK/SrfK